MKISDVMPESKVSKDDNTFWDFKEYLSEKQQTVVLQTKVDLLLDNVSWFYEVKLKVYNFQGIGFKKTQYSDWYLPSMDELNKLYFNQYFICGFASACYWSSSEVDAFSAFSRYFISGLLSYYARVKPNYVRAVRAF